MSALARSPALAASARLSRPPRPPTLSRAQRWSGCVRRELTPRANAQSTLGPALASASSPPSLLASTPGPHSDAKPPGNSGPRELSDQEWEIRTGRGIYILQQTLPAFFSTGLVSSLDTSSASSSTQDDDTSIYSPNVRLVYRPPMPVPPPFPHTLQVEGLSLYLASSVILRRTLNALYTDLRVELQHVRVHGPRSSSTSGLSASPEEHAPSTQAGSTRSIREKSLFIGISVRGTNRVSKAEGGWEVNSTYTFSPITGLIHLHTIDSIHPAPHQAFFDALQAALSKIGLGGTPGEGGVARASPRSQPDLKPVNRS
ncbi:hypothetical protein C2E23DRAFT_866666 [Lenzites betulinus]|nr:hypothetical protein C2E23DRAFT_866666 [Lenzites betulinus]